MKSMRRVGVIACLLCAFAVRSAAAQPPTASAWRAALAFGHAEGKLAALARFTVPATAASKKVTNAALDEIDRLAIEARAAFELVQAYRSSYWSIAAEIRIGDTYACEAAKLSSLPLPHVTSNPQVKAAQPQAVLVGLLQPLRDRAERSWQKAATAADQAGIASPWFALLQHPGC